MAGPETVADNVWLLRGGVPRVMNVYFIADDGRVTVFDSGIRAMTKQILAVVDSLGRIDRVVLSHSHVDHRGTAPYLARLCTATRRRWPTQKVTEALGYADTSKLEFPPARVAMPFLLRQWDGGPVEIAGTVEEGDDLAGGFKSCTCRGTRRAKSRCGGGAIESRSPAMFSTH